MYKKRAHNLAPILIAYMVLLVACNNIPLHQLLSSPPTETIVNSCIPPITPFAFSVKPVVPTGQEKRVAILPPEPWQVEAQLPALANGALQTSRILSVRTKNGYSEVWIRRQWTLIGEYNNQATEELWIYQADTKKWVSMPEQIGNTDIRIGELFLAKDGSLWSHNYISKSGEPLFSIYNERTNRFDLAVGSKGIPDGKVVLDQNDVFWIIPHQDSIYSYDPSTNIIKQGITLPGLAVYGTALGPDGTIYILKGSSYLQTSNDEELLHFYPQTDKVDEIGVPFQPPLIFLNLLVDHSGRLWLDDRGWMEPGGAWYEVVRSPIFITNNLESGSGYQWETPSILLESSDGRLWFQSNNGLAWLDPQKGEWCWFTTYKSNIVEDQQHNLWMIADNKLYEYSLNQ